MSTEKSCPNCRTTMRLEGRTPGFYSFECPKCAFVVIEVAKDDAPQGRTVSGRH
jgi:tRNA(Ile2) C34 agmatinyltransferase TiaS